MQDEQPAQGSVRASVGRANEGEQIDYTAERIAGATDQLRAFSHSFPLQATVERIQSMREQRIYIDTSVVGGCHDKEFAPWSRGLMHDFRSGIFHPVVSEIVTLEIEDAPDLVQETYEDLLRLDPVVLEVDEEETLLADQYLEREILTENYYDDAQHIALATIANVDVLASWNFRHIVHFDKIRQFNAVNLEQGYKPIDIRSPREVTYHGESVGGDGRRD